MEFKDKVLTCIDCDLEFVFGVAEQTFYALKNLKNAPRRCANCRLNRKLLRDGKNPEGYHEVVCAKCGSTTRVSFKPTGRKPVYCIACFKTMPKD